MKNVLLVTPLYPLPTNENNCTYVCHYFTREWVKLGYKVVVIHYQPIHLYVWHFIVKIFGKHLKNWAGGGNYYSRRINRIEHYEMDGVPIYRIPVFNPLPRGKVPSRSIKHFVHDVHSLLDSLCFVPDIITGHALALDIIPLINKPYNVKTCMVAHSIYRKLKQRYPNYEALIRYYDLWGFRNKAMKESFERDYCSVENSFYCYSGIPESYLTPVNKHSFDTPLSKYVYIGELIERKFPQSLLKAIPLVSEDYRIVYIGDGPLSESLKEFASKNDILQRVLFTGKVSRNEIVNYLDEADCLIMISKREAFGLVYLEAMARGCITIASKNEGFDGIIVDGQNGFLCEAGNDKELSSVLSRINRLSAIERQAISNNAIETARRMTDVQVAKYYVEQLEKL